MATSLWTFGTAKLWSDSGSSPTPDFTLSLQNMATAVGRIGGQWDRGAGDLEPYLGVEFVCRGATAPTIGNGVTILIAGSWDAAMAPADLGNADATITALDRIRNVDVVGFCEADQAATGVDFVFTGVVFCPFRYVSPVVWSTLGVNLVNTSGLNYLRLFPAKRTIA